MAAFGFASRFIARRYTSVRKGDQLVSFIARLSTAGVALGVALLICVLSVMNGFDRELRERILGLLPEASIYHRYGVSDWRHYVNELKKNPEVSAAAPFIQIQALVSKGREVAPMLVYGVFPKLESSVSILPDYLPASFAELEEGGVFIGKGIAQRLHVKAGDRLRIIIPDAANNKRPPKISAETILGVFHTGTEVDQSIAVMHFNRAAKLDSLDDSQGLAASGIRLKFNDLFSAPYQVGRLVRDLPYGFYPSDWTRTHGNLYSAIHMSKQMVALLLLLIVGIAAFNVVTSLIMVVIDKQGDIAILRTMGASRSQVMSVFILQGAAIGAIGTAIGVALGLLMTLGVTDFVAWFEASFGVQFLNSDVYPIDYLPSELQWGDVIFVASVALAMSSVAAIYPAWRASCVKPAEALRFEH